MRDELATKLKPASNEDFRNELTACLVLTVPTGMTQDERNTWLRAAWATLSHLPPDLLREGCAEARKRADHPSKIVSTILKTVEDKFERRKRSLITYNDDIQLIESQIRDELRSREADERAREIAKQAPKSIAPPPNHTGVPREPTRAEYIAMGVDPAILDDISSEKQEDKAA